MRRRRVPPEQLLQRLATVTQGGRRARVRDRRLDLPAVADDPRVREQPLDVGLAERGDTVEAEKATGKPRACGGSSATRALT
jgi:hypothetical protein